MRLWHKDLISVLPDKQLLAQWRECCCIATNIINNGTPNHILVNKIMCYNKTHFYNYCCMVCNEMFLRGWKISENSRNKILDFIDEDARQISSAIENDELFRGWHNERYLMQCYYNLQEKYDCGGIPVEQFIRVRDKVEKLTGEEIEL